MRSPWQTRTDHDSDRVAAVWGVPAGVLGTIARRALAVAGGR
jgi:hypothetical protein